MTQIPLISESELTPLPDKPPEPRCDLYIVVAYYAPQKWWKIFQDQFLTRECAEKAANELPGGYTHKRILFVPGEG